MTESEWLTCPDPASLLEHLRKGGAHRSRHGRRRLRLFACACARRVWHLMNDEPGRAWLERAERLADAVEGTGLLRPVELGQLGPVGGPRADQQAELAAGFTLAANLMDAAKWAALSAWGAVGTEAENRGRDASAARVAEREAQAALVRDLFGNPFRTLSPDPSWSTPAVVALARSIYDDRGFGRMPMLGDALEEAGCTEDELLDHCRVPGEHARGCWALDIILAKP